MSDLDALVATSLTAAVVALYGVNLLWTLRVLRRRGDERDLRDAVVAVVLLLGAVSLAAADILLRVATDPEVRYVSGVLVNAARFVLFIAGIVLLTRWRKR